MHAVGAVSAMFQRHEFERVRAYCREPIKALANPDTLLALNFRWMDACALVNEMSPLRDLAVGLPLLEEINRAARRNLGDAHDFTLSQQSTLNHVREQAARGNTGVMPEIVAAGALLDDRAWPPPPGGAV